MRRALGSWKGRALETVRPEKSLATDPEAALERALAAVGERLLEGMLSHLLGQLLCPALHPRCSHLLRSDPRHPDYLAGETRRLAAAPAPIPVQLRHLLL